MNKRNEFEFRTKKHDILNFNYYITNKNQWYNWVKFEIISLST